MTADLDHPCPDHGQRRCMLCYPPIGLWVNQGGGDLLRVDADGTRWTVCPISVGDYALTMTYQDRSQTVQLTSHHLTAEAAIEHRDQMARGGLVTHGAQPAAPAFPQCAVCLHMQFLRAERDLPAERVHDAVTTLHGTAVCRLHMEDVDRAAGNWLIRMVAGILGPHTPGQRY